MKSKYTGPVEDLKWASRLQAHVVTPGERPRIHGYDVRADLAGNISFSQLIILTLTGQLPTEKALQAFETVIVFLAPISVAEAPVHASVLAGLCGANSSGIMGVTGITLAQQASFIVTEHSELLNKLSSGEKQSLAPFGPQNAGEREETELLVKALEKAGLQAPKECRELNPVAAALTVLHKCCNITDPQVMEAVLVMARIPCVLAESRAVQPGGFRSYPIDLPKFEYRDE